MLEKFVGNRLETISINSFYSSFFLKEINLKNVREIGESAFQSTSLKIIKNKHIQELKNKQFSGLISEVKKVKMMSLTSLYTSVFNSCTINEFDAPNINSITVDSYATFTVGKKNFQDYTGIR